MNKLAKKNLKQTFEIIKFIFIVSSCITGIVFLQKKEFNYASKSNMLENYTQIEKNEKYKIDLISKIPSFGFDNLIADWSYLKFLQYFGDGEARNKTGYSLSSNYFNAVVKHDPKFVQAYFLLAPATSIFAGKPEQTVKYLEQGLEYITVDIHPKSYYLWVYKAIDEMLSMGNNKAAQESYEMAVIWAKQIDNPVAQRSAINIKRTAEFIAKDPDSTMAQIGSWTMVLSSTNDIQIQNKALKKIKQLGGEINISPDGSVSVKVPEKAT